MKLSNEYINKQYLINMLGCVHPEDRNWEEAIGIIEYCGTIEAYPINWIESKVNYNLNNIYERPYVIALPIRIGDTVFVDPSSSIMLKTTNYLRKGKVNSINFREGVIIFTAVFNKEETNSNLPVTLCFNLDDIGRIVFLKDKRLNYERK